VDSQEAYVNAAVALATDLPRLQQIRSELRARVAASPLGNSDRFTRNLESAYREMWRAWCRGSSTG
jgi:protein O-GlcNAc transferase